MKLAEVLTYKKGRAPQKMTSDAGREVVYLSPEYLRGNSEPSYVPDYPTKVEVGEEDLLLLWDGSNAGEFFQGKAGVLASTMVKFDFDQKRLNSKFFYYQLKAFESFLKAQTNGSGIPHVDREILLGLEAQEFSEGEQKRIAEILSTVDAAIEQTRELIDKYSRIKRGLMHDLLTRGIDEHGKVRSKQTHKFTIKNGIEVPDEWDVVPIGSLSEPITSGSRGWAVHYAVQGDKFIRIGNLLREHIDFRLDNMVFVDAPSGAEKIRTKLIEGDILISITADLGMIGVIPKGFGAAYNNQHIARVRVNEGAANPRWIGYFLLSQNGQAQFQMLNESGAKAGLNLPTVASLLIPVPDETEQQRIVEKLDSILKVLQSHQLSVVKLSRVKKGLMQDLLSGRKRVRVDA